MTGTSYLNKSLLLGHGHVKMRVKLGTAACLRGVRVLLAWGRSCSYMLFSRCIIFFFFDSLQSRFGCWKGDGMVWEW